MYVYCYCRLLLEVMYKECRGYIEGYNNVRVDVSGASEIGHNGA